MTAYQPGLHLIGEADSPNLTKLSDASLFKVLVDELVAHHGLTKVGEVYHSFHEAGFTAAVCLTESHLSVHTWPEYGKVTFDVFLSNFKRNNDITTQSMFDSIAQYFEASLMHKTELRR